MVFFRVIYQYTTYWFETPVVFGKVNGSLCKDLADKYAINSASINSVEIFLCIKLISLIFIFFLIYLLNINY